VDATQVIW